MLRSRFPRAVTIPNKQKTFPEPVLRETGLVQGGQLMRMINLLQADLTISQICRTQKKRYQSSVLKQI